MGLARPVLRVAIGSSSTVTSTRWLACPGRRCGCGPTPACSRWGWRANLMAAADFMVLDQPGVCSREESRGRAEAVRQAV